MEAGTESVAAMFEREGVLFGRHLPDGRWALLIAGVCNGRLVIDRDLSDGCFEEEYSYPTSSEALVALLAWEPDTEPDPAGWLRHVPSYRRRPDGDATREYVAA